MAKQAIIIGWASQYLLVLTAITTLYPLKAAENGISESMIGQVLGVYSVSSFLFLPISLWMLKRCSDLLVFEIGLALSSLVLVLVACLPFLSDPAIFLAISFLLRIIEGSADIMLNMAAMNIIQKSDNKAFYLNLMVGFFSIGSAMGPFLVTLLSSSMGFSGFYLSLGGVVFGSAILCRIFHGSLSPSSQKDVIQETLSDYHTDDTLNVRLTLVVQPQEITDLSFIQILKIKKIFIGLLLFMFVYSLWTFRDPVLPLYLQSQGVSESQIGYYYLTQTLANAIFGLSPLLLVKFTAPKTVITAGSLVILASLFLIGPSSLFHFGHSLMLTQVGLGLLGAAFNFAVSPVISDMMKGINQKYPYASSPEKVSLLYIGGRSLGYWLGPFLGSILYQNLGFSLTCDLFGIFYVIMICLYTEVLSEVSRLCRCKGKIEHSYRRLNGGNDINSYI